jgi:hypothetical protein
MGDSLRSMPQPVVNVTVAVVAGHGLVFTVLSFALAQGYAAANELAPGFFHFN